MSACRRDFDETKYQNFLINDDELLEKYNDFWEKVKSSIKKELDSKPVYKKKFRKLKRDLITVKTTQIFTIIKYQKKVLNLFVYK